MGAGCLGLFFRLAAEAVAIRMGQEVVKWLTGGRLQNLLATILAAVSARMKDFGR